MRTLGQRNPEIIQSYIDHVEPTLDTMLATSQRIAEEMEYLRSTYIDLIDDIHTYVPHNTITIGKYMDKVNEQIDLLNVDVVLDNGQHIDKSREHLHALKDYFENQYMETIRENERES